MEPALADAKRLIETYHDPGRRGPGLGLLLRAVRGGRGQSSKLQQWRLVDNLPLLLGAAAAREMRVWWPAPQRVWAPSAGTNLPTHAVLRCAMLCHAVLLRPAQVLHAADGHSALLALLSHERVHGGR